MTDRSGGEAFSKDRRLESSTDFDRVFAQTEVRVSRKGIVMLARRNQLSRSRLGMVISKRSLKLASDRNRLKRVIREWFRRDDRLRESSLDVIVMSRPGVKLTQAGRILAALQTDLLDRIDGLRCA